jgi:thiosulfate/3-mercaptopyruvate sulfurtransferase
MSSHNYAQKDKTMPAPIDLSPKIQQYAHPETLVSTDWLAANLKTENVVVVESDEDVLLYSTGHIPGAVKIDWHTDLNDAVLRDYLDGEQFAELMSAKGISRDTTVILYGDNKNWWAAYTLWVFKLFGHEDVRLLDGGREAWIAEGRELTTDATTSPRANYPAAVRNDSDIRAYRDEVLAHIGKPMVDVRSPQEYSGEKTQLPNFPDEGALRGGHIPGAASIPWSKAANEDSTFKDVVALKELYLQQEELDPSEDTIAYCRIGERSSHTWFVLKYLLGFKNVKNYDGSWTEWGSLVGVPIVKGTSRV